MKYFIDTEFIEGFWNAVLYKKRHFIDLISIGIVAEDGREYYAISNEFNPRDADKWVKENVINNLEQKATSFYDSPRLKQNRLLYKSNKQISNDILSFVYPDIFKKFLDSKDEFYNRTKQYGWETEQPEFYGYYCDYDWVLFCSLFGRMIDLPTGFPMYCRDLKQMLDECYIYQENKYENESRLEGWLKYVKNHPEYPKQEDEHNALADAKWNKELYDFIVNKKFINKFPSGLAKIKL